MLFDEYYGILEGEKAMTASHLVANSGKIIRAKPELQEAVTNKLLNIDEIHKGKQKELIKSYAIDAFDECFEDAKNREEILKFVKAQTDSKSPKTRKNAEKFLKKHINWV
jgi:hypothetical protein